MFRSIVNSPGNPWSQSAGHFSFMCCICSSALCDVVFATRRMTSRTTVRSTISETVPRLRSLASAATLRQPATDAVTASPGYFDL